MERLKINKSGMIYIAFALLMVLVISNKKNFYVDEMFSYVLANHAGGINMDFEEGYTYIPSEQVFIDNYAVYRDARFNFANVWENQTKDVHPPLYYLILHIICSLHAEKFSVWYAAMINIIFALLTLYILRKLMYLFADDSRVVDFGSLLFVVSAGVLQSVSFLRMYVMAMFWITLMTYLFVKAFDEKTTWKRWVQIGVTAVAGALTHYYCIIYLCAVCLVFGICLILQKRWMEIIDLIGYMVLSAGISISIFPAMPKHMFSGYRGTQSINNIAQLTRSEHWERMKSFYGFINTQMLGKIGGCGVVFIFLAVMIFAVLRKNEDDKEVFRFDKIKCMRWMILGIPIIIYFVFVSVSAAYVTDRYLFPIYAVTFGMFLCMMNAVWKRLVSVKYVYLILSLIGTMFIINGYANANWDYLYKSSEELLSKAKTYSYRHCISVYDKKWKEQPGFSELSNYKSVTFISQEHADRILQYENLLNDGFILNVIGGNDEGIIRMIQDNYPYLSKCEKIGEYAYSSTYHICTGEEQLKVYIYNYDRNAVIGADSLDLGGNVLMAESGQDLWLVRQDEDHAAVRLGKLVFDIDGAQYAEGANILLNAMNGSDTQSWKFVENEDGSFCLLTKDEQFALTCGGDGNIYLAAYHQGEISQKWWIEQ